jgi:hypothetical protein
VLCRGKDQFVTLPTAVALFTGSFPVNVMKGNTFDDAYQFAKCN